MTPLKDRLKEALGKMTGGEWYVADHWLKCGEADDIDHGAEFYGTEERSEANAHAILTLRPTGRGRQKSVTVKVSFPCIHDLRGRKEDKIVRRLLKDWGIDVLHE